jgi:predicted O-methyltransferase YrrM
MLSMISRMLKPRRILEVGTFTGYSAICLSEGLAENGVLITIDKNHELQEMVQRYFKEAGISSQVDYIIGDAMEVIPELDGTFDLIYLDADKENYCNYFDLLIEKVNPGGYLLADNVLWSGKVLEDSPNKLDRETLGIKEFNQKVHNDQRVENVLLPIRDGLMLLRKNL